MHLFVLKNHCVSHVIPLLALERRASVNPSNVDLQQLGCVNLTSPAMIFTTAPSCLDLCYLMPQLPPISTPSGAQLLQDSGGASPYVISTPGTTPSPTVDSVLHSIWVDIIDKEELRFGRRLGMQCERQPFLVVQYCRRG